VFHEADGVLQEADGVFQEADGVFQETDGVSQVADGVFQVADVLQQHGFVNYMTVGGGQPIGLIPASTSEIAESVMDATIWEMRRHRYSR
jgi:hypothetical protein